MSSQPLSPRSQKSHHQLPCRNPAQRLTVPTGYGHPVKPSSEHHNKYSELQVYDSQAPKPLPAF